MGAQSLLLGYGSGGGGGSSYLDGLATTPHLVLSLRKMISTATVAIRVRRSSDNAEQDIGFTGNALDTANLATFVGANNAFVVTFYDQTGNGRNATQATASKQPQIVSSGTYLGRATWNGSSHALTIPSLTMGTQFAGVYTKIKLTSSGSFKMIVEHGSDAATTAGGFGFYGNNDSTNWDIVMANGGGGSARGKRSALSAATLDQVTILYDRSLTGADEIKIWRAGSVVSGSNTSTIEQTGNFSTQTLNIGARNGTSLYADMWLETLALYSADSSGIRTSIEAIVA